tara:strand:+ start:1350 stop:1790 length:441 start_codon:yes stop_codon:yes gene_type:complete
MKILIKIIFLNILLFNNCIANSTENYFDEAVEKYNLKDYKKSKFLFQRNIVFNPKDADSYLYLAKIYKSEENQNEEEKNLNTTLLLQPNNEEAIYMLIEINLDKSNFSEANQLLKKFETVCQNFCSKKKQVKKDLQNLEAKNENKQ